MFIPKVGIRDLVDICRKDRVVKPPWVEDEEDRCFTGYLSMVDMLEDHGIDVKKVSIDVAVWTDLHGLIVL